MTLKRVFVVCLGLFVLASCGGGSSPDVPDVTEELDNGQELLANGNYSAAKTAYCDAAQANPSDPDAAFGCAMNKAIAIGESEPINALLEGIGEDPVSMQEDFMDDGGFFDTLFAEFYAPKTNMNDGRVQAKDFYWLPVVNFFGAGGDYEKFLEKTLPKMLISGLTPAQIQENLLSVANQLAEIHNHLVVAKNATDFSFTIPADFFHTNEDVIIQPMDIYLFDSGVQMARFGIELANRYEPIVEINKISHDIDSFDVEALVDNLNGADGGPVFGQLRAGVVDFLSIKPLFVEALSDGRTALQMLSDGSPTNLFSGYFKNKAKLAEKIQVLKDLEDSLSTGMTVISSTDGKLAIDLKLFFENPPDSKKLPIDTPDPFDYAPKKCVSGGVVCTREKPMPVEVFFKEYFKNIVDFDL